ncbi:Fis family PAS modulated sigma54 specific transcriptional regulator [Candidatus Magnetomorum sp. HK-1]|nr:Fis family PAS modulated sigma54 specific transcriptional regulator [Candidatus Magnetomorum sp. HK-1]
METILIVDDQPDTLSLLNKILINEGYIVRTALTVDVALKSALKYVPDLILMDVYMPEINGFEACNQFKQNNQLKDVPIIFITARTGVQDIIKGFQVGGIDYITKPFACEEVLARVQTHLRIQQEQQRYYALANASTEGIVIHHQNEIIDINYSVEKMMQCSRENMIHKQLSELFSKSFIQSIGQNKSAGNRLEIIERRHDGVRLYLEVHAQPIEYLSKTLEMLTIRDITNTTHLKKKYLSLKASITSGNRLGAMVGKSTVMKKLFSQIVDFAGFDETVMITGETGTGKELVAKNIHQLSELSRKPFIIVNCAAVPETLFESSFFGHSKGAFTNATGNKEGFLDQANGGILFLDEVGELSISVQAKLLRVLETGVYTPLGGKNRYADIRLISATNKDLYQMVSDGTMRKDFFHRLNVLTIDIPPLRKRKEDIPLLIHEFIERNRSKKIPNRNTPDHLVDHMMTYHWPGNVRELFNELRRFCYTGKLFKIDYSEFPDETTSLPFLKSGLTLKEAVSQFEEYYIGRALSFNKGARKKTAKMLDITPRTLYNKAKNCVKSKKKKIQR